MLLSSQLSLANYNQCDENITNAVEQKLTDLGKIFQTKEGYKHFTVEYHGDGFFDVSYLTWNQEDQSQKETLTFEVVIDGNCNPYLVTLIEDAK